MNSDVRRVGTALAKVEAARKAMKNLANMVGQQSVKITIREEGTGPMGERRGERLEVRPACGGSEPKAGLIYGLRVPSLEL